MMRGLLFIAFIMCMPLNVLAQNASSVGFNVYAGKMLDIHPFFPEVDLASNYEITYSIQTDGKKSWHQYYGFPELGGSLSYAFLGDKDTLGNVVSAVPFMRFGKTGKHFSVQFRVGFGLGYFTKPFDALSNNRNLVIGSSLTAAVNGGADFSYRLSNKMDALGSFAIWHYSNGHFRVPNIGANLVYGSLGVKYHFNRREETLEKSVYNVERKFAIGLQAALGLQEIEGTVYPYDGPLYSVFDASLFGSYRTSYHHLFSFGINYNFYQSYYDEIRSQELFEDNWVSNASKWIVYVGHEYLFGRFGFFVNLGYNLSYPIKERWIALDQDTDKFAHKYISGNLGFNLYLKPVEKLRNNPYVGIGLKSIGGKADYVQLRLGVAF